MEPKFTTTSLYTYDEYKRLNRAVSGKTRLIITIAFVAFCFTAGLYYRDIFFFYIGTVFAIAMYLIWAITIKSLYKSNRLTQNIEITYDFFDTHFTATNKHGVQNIEYDLLRKAVFTKTNVYLLISKNQAFLLTKKNFPDGLEDFLKGVAPEKKKREQNVK